MPRHARPAKLICLFLCLLFLLSLVSCQKEDFRAPTTAWLNSLQTLLTQCAAENPEAYSGAVDNLKQSSADAKAHILALETLDRYPNAKAFLLVVVQFADVFAQEPDRLLLDYPNYWIAAVWQADSILTAAADAETEEAYLSAIDAEARTWLDMFYRAENGAYRVTVPEEIPWDVQSGT